MNSRLLTGSIAHSTKCRYSSYTEGDFEVFRPTEATRCTSGGEIWIGGVDRRSRSTPCQIRSWSTPPCQISLPLVQLIRVCMRCSLPG